MPNLRSCTVSCRQAQEDVIDKWYSITLHHLRHLSLLKPFDSSPSNMLKHLTLPNLRTLRIQPWSETNHLLLFLERSQCRLEGFQLELLPECRLKGFPPKQKAPELTDIQCLRILEAIPWLLLDCEHAYTDEFMNCLIASPTLLPSLQSLKMEGDFPYDISVIMRLRDARPQLAFMGGGFTMRSRQDLGETI